MIDIREPTAPIDFKSTNSGTINLTSTCVVGDSARSPRLLDRLPVFDLDAFLKVRSRTASVSSLWLDIEHPKTLVFGTTFTIDR